VVRKENIQVDNAALDAEFNQTLSALTMQGVDLNKVRGGRQGQQRVAQAVAMESANRVLTRKALDVLKSIATGEYKPPEAVQEETAVSEEAAPEVEVTVDQEASATTETAQAEGEAEEKSE
jgi:hypothetical protein